MFNEYLNLSFTFNWNENPIKYSILIQNNTIKIHSCAVNNTEFDKSRLIINYR